MEKKPITPEGQQKLRSELDNLKNIKRQEIIDAISEARAHGDLKENAEYHAAREEQGLNEARIRELEDVLAISQSIEYKTNEGEMVGDWEINLESNDPASDFTYNYNWVTYFQDNS